MRLLCYALALPATAGLVLTPLDAGISRCAGLATPQRASSCGVASPQRPRHAPPVLLLWQQQQQSAALLTEGDAMEAGWDRLRGRPLRRSLALWKFFSVATWKVIRGNRSETAEAEAALWVRDGLLRLGPTMIKLGQVFSSRTDLLPKCYTDALCTLQDAVPTVSAARVRSLLDDELGSDGKATAGVAAFDSFDDKPIAGASLGQVHRAVYRGRPCAVKVQRRGLKELFDTDFRNLRLMARVANFIEGRRRLEGGASAAKRDWLEYTDDAARLLYMEIDYVNEARNAKRFDDALPRSSKIRVPRVEWEATTAKVLTMEYVESLKLTDLPALDAAGLDRQRLCSAVVDAFLMQLLDTGVLHCDPHPGNMCVDRKGNLVYYDFGMLDELSPDVRLGLRAAATALFGGSANPSQSELQKSAAQLVDGVQRMGFVSATADRSTLLRVGAFAIRFFKDSAAGRATQDVGEKVGAELQGLVDEGAIGFPSIFTFVGRAFASVDGIGKRLDDNYDFRLLSEPFVGRLIEEQMKADGAAWRESLGDQLENLWSTPSRVASLDTKVAELESGEVVVKSRNYETEAALKAVRAEVGSLRALLLASLLTQLVVGGGLGGTARTAAAAAAALLAAKGLVGG